MSIRTARAVLAGIGGTIAMTAVGVWVAPMMGMPLFSGSMALAGGSLLGHLVYGAVVGTIYRRGSADADAAPEPATS